MACVDITQPLGHSGIFSELSDQNSEVKNVRATTLHSKKFSKFQKFEFRPIPNISSDIGQNLKC